MAAIVLELVSPGGEPMHRKKRKVHLSDPFASRVLAGFARTELGEAAAVEGTVASHLSRVGPVFYWRNGSEADVVALHGGRRLGFEVKWGFKKGTKPRHIHDFVTLDRGLVPLFLGSLALP